MGSQSLGRVELDERREIGVIVRDPTVGRDIQTVFERDWRGLLGRLSPQTTLIGTRRSHSRRWERARHKCRSEMSLGLDWLKNSMQLSFRVEVSENVDVLGASTS